MKNISLFALFAFSLFSSVSAQEKVSISKDEYTMNGDRVIVTSEEEFYDDETVGMTYQIIKETGDTLHIINITLEDWGKMEKGRSFFMKFKDDSIIELKNMINQVAHPLSGHMGMFGPAMCLQPAYIISKEQLMKICSGEIVKLRFEQGDDLLDRKIKKNKFSKIIKSCYELLENVGKTKRDLLQGF